MKAAQGVIEHLIPFTAIDLKKEVDFSHRIGQI